MGLRNIGDILRYFPQRYIEPSPVKSIEFLIKGQEATIFGKISKLKTSKTFRTKIAISSAEITDATGKVEAIWFSQPYMAKMFNEGATVRIEGKVSESKKWQKLYFSNPKIEKVDYLPDGTSESLFPEAPEHILSPVYRESRGLSSNWIHYLLQKIFRMGILETINDPIPSQILKKYNLPSLKTSLFWIHTPRKKSDAEAARKRFAFEEIFLIQLDRQKERLIAHRERSFVVSADEKDLDVFAKNFPFPLTSAQKKATQAIIKDLRGPNPMSRLLEGDVGSGKTAVAAMATFAVAKTPPQGQQLGNLQVAYMAPTEILAEQHFESFISYFRKDRLPIGLLTGSGAKKFPSKTDKEQWTKISKSQLLKWVENGNIPILIGTHALIENNVIFKNLGFIIIDEQHRFGVNQRKRLRKKQDIAPHLLSMTATPIPRTLALTLFGDLDLSILDELPKGRQLPETKIVLPQERGEIYEKVREELRNGRQAFVICPRIDDPDPDKETSINARSVKSEAERLAKKIFPEFKIGAVTGKLKPIEKEGVMRDFKNHKIDILVATSVVEVGVNIPNATVMIIENAERFGLSQLHQFRGRILRSFHKPYCFVFAESKSEKTINRLQSFMRAKNGFELAEADLKQRGAGDLLGIKQWGVSDLAMEALKNIKMVEAARAEALGILEKDLELKDYAELAKHLSTRSSRHLE